MNGCDLSAFQFIVLNTSVSRYSCRISCQGGWEAVAHLFQFGVCLSSFLNLSILVCCSSSGSIQAAIYNLISLGAAPRVSVLSGCSLLELLLESRSSTSSYSFKSSGYTKSCQLRAASPIPGSSSAPGILSSTQSPSCSRHMKSCL